MKDGIAFPHTIIANLGRAGNQRLQEQGVTEISLTARTTEQESVLENAETLLLVVANTIQGVYQILDTTREDNGTFMFELIDIPAFAALEGHRLNPDGVFWKAGDPTHWKELPAGEFKELQDISRRDRIQFGAHTILLRADGSLEIGLAPGYRVDVVSNAPLASAKQRIEDVVKRLGESRACTTYQCVADMLGIRSPRSVGRSIARNDNISLEEGARVLRWSYREGDDWIIPKDAVLVTQHDDHGFQAVGDHEVLHADILVADKLATRQDNGDAVVDPGSVIVDAAALRRYLKI